MKHLPDVKPLTWKGDLAARMVAGIDEYLRRTTAEHAAQRERTWKRDTQSWARYEKSVAPNRQRLAKFLGVVDERVEGEMIAWGHVSSRGQWGREDTPAQAGYSVQAVRWTVLPGLTAEGLLLEPEGEAVADVVALGDADWAPEEVVWGQCGRGDTPAHAGFAGRLAASGCRVLIPTLINRDCEWSGVAGCMTNQPHREFIYRAAYELGRHVIGLEVQKVLAAVDWFGSGASGASASTRPVGVIGYGEGGLLALHAAALDARIGAVVVSGYFGPREGLFAEPIYRNVWRLLEEFGDAEIASLIAPRTLIVEHCPFPEISGPPPVSEGRSGAAPGSIKTPTAGAVRREMARARELLGGLQAPFTLVEAKAPGSDAALGKFVQALALPAGLAVAPLSSPGAGSGCHGQPCWPCGAAAPDPRARLKRQFDEMVEWTQALMRESEYIRRDYWAQADATDVKSWVRTTKAYRKRFHEEVIGALPESDMPPNPRARQVFATEAFTGYEVVLDVYPSGARWSCASTGWRAGRRM